ncbi:hypothetical protein GC173_16440 [bacterium]|nr:hypothetical protein [bacterium]
MKAIHLSAMFLAISTAATAQFTQIASNATYQAWNATIVGADAEGVSAVNGKLFLLNGGDTSDGDGDCLIRLSTGTTPAFEAVMCSGNQIEAAIADATGTTVNTDWHVEGLANGGAIVAVGDDSGLEAWLLRVNPASTVASPSIDALAGDDNPGAVIAGLIDIAVEGNTIYALVSTQFGAAESKILTFDAAGAGAQVGTTIVTNAQIVAAFGGTPSPVSISKRGSDLVIVDGASKSIATVATTGGTPTVLRAGSAIEADLGGAINTWNPGGIAVNADSDDIFLSVQDDELSAASPWNIVRLDGTTLVASYFLTETTIEASSVWTAGPGDEVEDQNYGLAASEDGNLYFSTESSNLADQLFRIEMPTAPVAPLAATDWNLYR